MSIESIIERAAKIRDQCVRFGIKEPDIIAAIITADALDSAASTIDDRLHQIDLSLEQLARR